MRIGEYLETLYESSRKGSADFMISEYLLMHYSEKETASLTKIAKDLGLSKSTVSAFFSSAGLPGGYDAFCAAAESEKRSVIVSLDVHVRLSGDLVRRLRNAGAVSRKDIGRMAKIMLESESVLFIGPLRYRDMGLSAVCLLRYLGIRCRFMPVGSISSNSGELSSLTEKDAVFFLSPDYSATEFEFRLSTTTQFRDAYRTCGGKKYFICPSAEAKQESNIFPFKMDQNPYERPQSVLHFSGLLFLALVKASGIDLSSMVYII